MQNRLCLPCLKEQTSLARRLTFAKCPNTDIATATRWGGLGLLHHENQTALIERYPQPSLLSPNNTATQARSIAR